MSFKFEGLLNRKYKKINGKVRFVGVRLLPNTVVSKRTTLLVSNGYGLLSASELEAARRILKKVIGKSRSIGVFLRVFPFIPLTGKPSEVRMGRGKGSRIRKWVYSVKPGKILFEISNISPKRGFLACRRAAEKLSVGTKILRMFKLRSSIHDF